MRVSSCAVPAARRPSKIVDEIDNQKVLLSYRSFKILIIDHYILYSYYYIIIGNILRQLFMAELIAHSSMIIIISHIHSDINHCSDLISELCFVFKFVNL